MTLTRKNALNDFWVTIEGLQVRESLFHWSNFIGLVLMAVFSYSGIQGYHFREPFLEWLSGPTYYLDPLAIHIAIIILIASLVTLCMGSISLFKKTTYFLLVSCILVLVMMLEFEFEKWLFKPIFDINRPPLNEQLPEGPITLFLYNFVGITGQVGTSTPSGSVLRQMLLTMGFLLLSQQQAFNTRFSGLKSKSFYALFAILLALVSFSRIYRGMHTFLDVGVAIGMGTMIFWLFVVFLPSSKMKNLQPEFTI